MKKRYNLNHLETLPEQDLDAIHGELLALSIVLDSEIRFIDSLLCSSGWLADEEIAKNQDEYEAMLAPLYRHEERLESCRRSINELDEHISYLLGRWVFDCEISPEQFDKIKAAIGIAQRINRAIGTRDDTAGKVGLYLGYIYRMSQEDAIQVQDLFE